MCPAQKPVLLLLVLHLHTGSSTEPLPDCLLASRAGAAPAQLPAAFMAFVAMGLPLRIYDYAIAAPVNLFFLADFCYAVCGAVAAYLLMPALHSPSLEAALYALADGPVAAALIVWECAWVFPSQVCSQCESWPSLPSTA